MKSKRLRLVILLAFAAVFHLTVKADSMPRYYGCLMHEYLAYSNSYDYETDLSRFVADKEHSFYVEDLEREISAFKQERGYTQEQMLREIDEVRQAPEGSNYYGEFPDYISAKGKYTYRSGTVGVYPTTNLNLRSQPNPNARIVYELRKNINWVRGELPDVLTYLGEWVNPEGVTWIAVSLELEGSGETIAGWVNGKYVNFITASQISEVVEEFERVRAKLASGSASPSSRRAESGGSVVKVPASTLIDAYLSNPYKAQKTYQGKTLEVRGKIYELTSEDGVPVIIFWYDRDGYKSAWIRCYVSRNDSLLADLETGGYATIRGYVSEVYTGEWIYAYKLTNCIIISAE